MPIATIALTIFVVLLLFLGIKVVPQQQAHVIERLGKFHAQLNPGLNFIIPFVDRVAYKFSLKEVARDIPEQVCVTADNVQVGVDGVVFLQIVDAKKAAYGIGDYSFAVSQLAQTTMRSEIGKIDLDKCFEERTNINAAVVSSIDEAAQGWGVKVLRYEIKNITPPTSVLNAMEKQMQAEREKRAKILYSEGEKQSAINVAEGNRVKVVLESEAERQTNAIKAIAQATAEGIEMVASAIKKDGGLEAVQLRVAENLVEQYGKLAKETNTMILPANFADIGSLVTAAMSVVKQNQK
jgi:regulator of protease activity HflC (stomatin/prohibitin superfamily)